jgi:superfamily II RNA helicase
MTLFEAAKLLKPKAIHVSLPSATIRNVEELDEWIDNVRSEITEGLKNGPVIVL